MAFRSPGAIHLRHHHPLHHQSPAVPGEERKKKKTRVQRAELKAQHWQLKADLRICKQSVTEVMVIVNYTKRGGDNIDKVMSMMD